MMNNILQNKIWKIVPEIETCFIYGSTILINFGDNDLSAELLQKVDKEVRELVEDKYLNNIIYSTDNGINMKISLKDE